MKQTETIKEKFLLFLRLFLPILGYQFANYSASFIDTMMTGQYSTIDLAGVAMANGIWWPFFSFSTGIVSALVPIVSQDLGKGDQKHLAKTFWQFIYMGLILTFILSIFIYVLAGPILAAMHLDSQVLRVATSYLMLLGVGVLPFLSFSIIRSLLDALGYTRLSMYLMFLLVPFNSFFNYLLIYGKMGLAPMGGAGAGLGTALAYWVVLVISLSVLAFHPKLKEMNLLKVRGFDWNLFKESLLLGLPIGSSVFAEVSIFAVVGLWMAKFTPVIIAAHQAAMNFATLLYAFPFAVSSSMAILVAFEVGAKRMKDVREYCRIGRLVALFFSICTLTLLYFLRENIAALYGEDALFIQQTSFFLTLSLCFQFGDAYAAPLQGILRGYKDTTIPFLLMLFSYWAVPLPLGILLEKVTQLGPASYWLGLIVSIFLAGFLLEGRLRYVEKKYSQSLE